MQINRGFTYKLIVGLGSVFIAGSVSAATAAPGYVHDSSDKKVTSDHGECVLSGNWHQGLSTPECDPALAARLETERLNAERLAAQQRAAEEAMIAAKLALLESPAAAPTLVRLSDQRNVMFRFNSALLASSAADELDKVIDKIQEFDQVDGIEIVGHTDSSGPESYNQMLSEQRSYGVKQFLESRGVKAALVSARGVGESSPIASNATRDGRAMNRRVDVLISGSTRK